MITSVKHTLPGPRSRELFARWERVEAQCTGYQAQVAWERACGVIVTDVDGNVFIDWTSGVLVTNVGHCHPDLVRAVQEASAKLLNNYECLHEPRVEAAEKLVSVLPKHLDKCFFLSTGSEAVEACDPHHEAEDRQVRNRQLPRRLPRTHLRRTHRGRPGRPEEGLRADAARRHPRPLPLLLPLPLQGAPRNLRYGVPGISR